MENFGLNTRALYVLAASESPYDFFYRTILYRIKKKDEDIF